MEESMEKDRTILLTLNLILTRKEAAQMLKILSKGGFSLSTDITMDHWTVKAESRDRDEDI